MYGSQRLIIIQRVEIHATIVERPRWRDGRLVSPEFDHTKQPQRSPGGDLRRPNPMLAFLAQMRLKMMMKYLARRRFSSVSRMHHAAAPYSAHQLRTSPKISVYGTESRRRGYAQNHEARGSVIVWDMSSESTRFTRVSHTSPVLLTRVSTNLSSAGPKPSVRTVNSSPATAVNVDL